MLELQLLKMWVSSHLSVRVLSSECSCLYVCMCICVSNYLYLCVFILVWVYICMCVYVSTFVCMYMCVCVCVCVCVYVCLSVCQSMFVFMCHIAYNIRGLKILRLSDFSIINKFRDKIFWGFARVLRGACEELKVKNFEARQKSSDIFTLKILGYMGTHAHG